MEYKPLSSSRSLSRNNKMNIQGNFYETQKLRISELKIAKHNNSNNDSDNNNDK